MLRAIGELEIVQVELDRPGPGEMIVEVTACGLCHSDLHMIDGHLGGQLPMVVGHEVAGVVEQIGSGVVGLEPGDRVVLTLSQFCGSCPACDRGEEWLCDRREAAPLVRAVEDPPRVTVAGEVAAQFLNVGGFADRVLVHQQSAVRVSPEVPAEVAALLGCGVLTGVGTIVNVARVMPGESVVIVGCGGVGLAAIQGARIAGAGRIVAVDVASGPLAMAERLGATDLLDAGQGDPVGAVRRMTGRGADHVVEAIGLPATMTQAIEMVRPGGTAYLVGIAPVGAALSIDAFKTVWFNRTIRGVLMGANRFRRDIPRLAELYLRGALDVESMITSRIGLDEVPAAFDRMRSGVIGRTVAVW